MKISLLLISFFCGSLQAQGLTAGELPAGSDWYLHANVQLLRDSELTAPFYAESLGEAFADIKDDLGIDLTNEVQAITVFGAGIPMDNGGVVMHGTLSAQTRSQLDELMRSASHYAEHDYGGALYLEVDGLGQDNRHRSNDSDSKTLVHFAADQTFITNDVGNMQRFIDGGARLTTIDSIDPQALFVLQADRALVQGGFNARKMEAGQHWDSSILKNVEQAAGVVSELHGGLAVHLEIVAANAETAIYVQNIVQGLISLKALSGNSEPWLDEVVNQLDLRSDGPRVTVNLNIPAELAARIVDEM